MLLQQVLTHQFKLDFDEEVMLTGEHNTPPGFAQQPACSLLR